MIQMMKNAYQATEALGDCLLLLGRYFLLTVPTLEKLKKLTGAEKVRREIVTKAKNPASHLRNPDRKAGKGAKKEPLST